MKRIRLYLLFPFLLLPVAELSASQQDYCAEGNGATVLFLIDRTSSFDDQDKNVFAQGVDTLFLVGFSTSGCVRASTLDAMQYGYVPFTVADACGDRDEAIQNANLHDLGAKYAEIITSDQVEALLPN